MKDNTDIIFHLPKKQDSEINYQENTDGNMDGKVYMERLSNLPGSPHLRAAFVKFVDGAKTHWHRHSDGQILYVKKGVGFIEQKDHPSLDILPGDRVYIPDNVWHRHGAKPGETMVHLAITNGTTDWDEK